MIRSTFFHLGNLCNTTMAKLGHTFELFCSLEALCSAPLTAPQLVRLAAFLRETLFLFPKPLPR